MADALCLSIHNASAEPAAGLAGVFFPDPHLVYGGITALFVFVAGFRRRYHTFYAKTVFRNRYVGSDFIQRSSTLAFPLIYAAFSLPITWRFSYSIWEHLISIVLSVPCIPPLLAVVKK